MKTRILLVLAAGVALGPGCNFAPEHKPVAMPMEDRWPGGAAYEDLEAGGEKTLGELRWDRFFASPELVGLIERGLEHNRQLQEAALNVEAARARYRIERAELLPSVSAGAQVNVERVPSTLSRFGAFAAGGEGEVITTYRANIGLASYEIDFFGRIRNMNEAALQEFFALREVRRSVRVTLVAEIANAWLTLLADRRRLALTAETLRTQEESLALVKRRFDAGIANALALRQAQSQVERARADLAALTRQVALDLNALVLLVGAPIDESRLKAGFGEADDVLRDQLPPGMPSSLLVNRPDIRAAEHRLRGANANIGAARAAFFPSISLTGSVGTAATDLTDLFSPASFAWSFLPQINIPIFHGAAFAGLDLAHVRKEITIVQYERTIQEAFREVADALAARETLADQARAQAALVASLREAYELSRLRYETGVDDYLVVLDSQRALYEAEQQEVQLRLQLLTNLVTLYRVLGGGELPTPPLDDSGEK